MNKRRWLFRLLALALALLVLAFVVSRGGAPQRPAGPVPVAETRPTAAAATAGAPAGTEAPLAAPAPSAEAPPFGAQPGTTYGIIGPATKNDPHTVRRAVQSLAEPGASASGSAPPPQEKP
jgi:hypothetical protein